MLLLLLLYHEIQPLLGTVRIVRHGFDRAPASSLTCLGPPAPPAPQLVSGPGLGLAPPLCEAVQALLARLQEQVAAAAAVDPLAGMPLPARCNGLLQLMLEVAWQVGWAGLWECMRWNRFACCVDSGHHHT